MIEVISPGPLATVQDLGRPGYAELGVGRSGAADRGAHRLANRLVGNAESAATIEITFGGLDILLTAASTVAFTGARCAAVEIGSSRAIAWSAAASCAAGTRLRLGVPAVGVRSYLAIRGGISVQPVLGSRATDTLAGLGPAQLQAGDLLPVGHHVVTDPASVDGPQTSAANAIRLLAGPRADWFGPSSMGQLTTERWLVAQDSNRIGVRLTGPTLGRARHGELPPEPTLPGAIQVPPTGSPIVLGPDAPVTGGYPVLAVVVSADLDRLAQLRPGEAVRFELGHL